MLRLNGTSSQPNIPWVDPTVPFSEVIKGMKFPDPPTKPWRVAKSFLRNHDWYLIGRELDDLKDLYPYHKYLIQTGCLVPNAPQD